MAATTKLGLAQIESSETFEEQIAALAYALWEERGCPDGSPEEDWLRAEKELTA